MKLSIHHACIQTDHYEESLAFWADVLGFSVDHATKGFHGRDFNTWLSRDGFSIELQTPKAGERAKAAPGETLEGLKHICFRTDDIEATVAELCRSGCVLFKEKDGGKIYEVEGTRLCKIVAPEGTVIEFRE